MKILIMLIMSMMMSGCLYQNVDHTDIQKAIKFCDGAGGIKVITSAFTSRVTIECLNGSYTNTMHIDLVEDDD